MTKTKIEWTDETWNPVTGCSKISAGCANCYAERMAARLQRMGQKKYRDGFAVTLHDALLDEPAGWRTPRQVFVCSMADLFHEAVPFEFIGRVFETMRKAPAHRYQVLTKRAERMLEFATEHLDSWPDHVWAGVTIEHNDYVHRADFLREVPASTRFISAEPLLGPLPDLRLDGVTQLIVGGESGPGSRPMQADWVRDLRDRSDKTDVLFFFKQWGGLNKNAAGRELDGRIWSEFPGMRGGDAQ